MHKNKIDVITTKIVSLDKDNLESFCYLSINKTFEDKLYYLVAILKIQFQDDEEIIWSFEKLKWVHNAMSDYDWLEGMPVETYLDYHDDSDIKTEEIIKFMNNEEILARILDDYNYFDKEI